MRKKNTVSIRAPTYGGFWVRGGQTLGLRSWRLRLDGGPITWMHAFKHFAGAILSWPPLGLGFLWPIFDREKLAWHDRLSGTRHWFGYLK